MADRLLKNLPEISSITTSAWVHSTDGSEYDKKISAENFLTSIKSLLAPKIFQATSTDTSTDYNTTSWPSVQWDSEDIKDTGYTHSETTNPERITIAKAGRYLVSSTIVYELSGTDIRIVLGVRINLNGTSLDYRGLDGYARQDPSTNQSSSNIIAIVDIASDGDYIEIQAAQKGDSGTANLVSSASIVTIKSIITP